MISNIPEYSAHPEQIESDHEYSFQKRIEHHSHSCFFCDGKVDFWFFYHCYHNFGSERMLKIWEDDHFQMLCKMCYEELKRQNIQKLLNNENPKERNCYQCGNPLKFWDYCSRNFDLEPKKLVNIWQCKYVEIYCCNCHDQMQDLERKKRIRRETVKAKRNLSHIENEALSFIESQVGRTIPKLSHINYFGSYGFLEENNHVVGLALSNANLVAIPQELRLFKHLKYFSIDHNPIAHIPLWIAEIVNQNTDWINIFNKTLVEDKENLKILLKIQNDHPNLLIISRLLYTNEGVFNISESFLKTFMSLAYSGEK